MISSCVLRWVFTSGGEVTCAILVFFCWNWQSLRIRAPDSSVNCCWKGWSSCTCSPKLHTGAERRRVDTWVTGDTRYTALSPLLLSLCFLAQLHQYCDNKLIKLRGKSSHLHTDTCPTSSRVRALMITDRDSNASCNTHTKQLMC